MKKVFATRADGQVAHLYTITGGGLTAEISDHGATLVKLFVPDAQGNMDDVILGFDSPDAYTKSTTYFGATVGRNANRVGNATFTLNGKVYTMDPNDNGCHNLHSGFDPYKNRLWEVVKHEENSIRLRLLSPDGDQGFPGNAEIHVTYTLEAPGTLAIFYDGICDKDTVFNMTNHTYFNLAGHKHPEKAMDQILSMPARHFTVCDAASIPTGENRSVEGSPMDFRQPKPIGRDINADYDALKLQGGYDHNFEVFTDPCAILSDKDSGRTMAVSTDCCGIQFYSGNFLEGEIGKDGVSYCHRGGICLETQFYPDCINHPDWKQPIAKAGQRYHSETRYKFN
ncbi:MAG: galactose mutarotase [Oscillospiraceae bacterium]|nr:galactose mutarotase [Oscillospiraceae bacterium]